MSRWRRPDAEELTAFEAFTREHFEALTILARGLAPSSEAAQDLLQETLARVLERWERVGATNDPYPYTRRVMVNLSISTWRRGRQEQHHRSAEDVLKDGTRSQPLLWDSGSGLDGGVGAHDERAALVGVLRGLPARQRAVVVLRYLEDMADAEVAAVLGISAVTVRTTSRRALRRMEGLLLDASR